jgi:hypothetical protein
MLCPFFIPPIESHFLNYAKGTVPFTFGTAPLTHRFPVLHYGPVPLINPATCDFRLWGEVEAEQVWTREELTR